MNLKIRNLLAVGCPRSAVYQVIKKDAKTRVRMINLKKALSVLYVALILIFSMISCVNPKRSRTSKIDKNFLKISQLFKEHEEKLHALELETKDEFETTEMFQKRMTEEREALSRHLQSSIGRDTVDAAIPVEIFNYDADQEWTGVATAAFFSDSLILYKGSPVRIVTDMDQHIQFYQISKTQAVFRVSLCGYPADLVEMLKKMIEKKAVVLHVRFCFSLINENSDPRILIPILSWSLEDKRISSVIARIPWGEPLDKMIKKAESYESSENYTQAVLQYRKIMSRYPDYDAGLYKMALVYANGLHEYETAIIYFKILIGKFPESEYTPRSQFMIGFIYANYMNEAEKAHEAYQTFVEKYPNHELTPSVIWELKYTGKSIDEIVDEMYK